MKRLFCLTLAALILSAMAGDPRTNAAPRADVSDLLQLLPEGNAVALIDVQRATGSAFWASISSQEKVRSTFDKMESAAGDLGVKFSDLQSIALSFRLPDNEPAVAITGNFDQNSLLTRLRANPKIKLTSEKYKDYDIYRVDTVAQPASAPVPDPSGSVKATPKKSNAGDSTSFVFFDSKTAVVGTKGSVRAAVDVKTGAKPSIAQNAQLIAGLSENPSAAVRFSIIMTPGLSGKIQTSEFPLPDFAGLKQVFGSVDLTTGIELVATLRNETAEQAKGMA